MHSAGLAQPSRLRSILAFFGAAIGWRLTPARSVNQVPALLASVILPAFVLFFAVADANAETVDWNYPAANVNIIAGSSNTTVNGVTVTTSAAATGSFTSNTAQIAPAASSNGSSVGIIQLNMDATNDNLSSYQTVTISFSEPIYNLAFTVLDIDGGPNYPSGDWNDIIDFNSNNGFPAGVVTNGGWVTYNAGTGRASAISNQNATNGGANQANGNIRVTYAGPVTSVTVRHYAAAVTGTNNPSGQVIFIDDLTFQRAPRLAVQKSSTGGTGSTTFNFNVSNSGTGTTATSVTTSGAAVTGTAIRLNATSTATTITETGPAGWQISPASSTCTDTNSANSGNAASFAASVSGLVVTVPAANIRPGAELTCAITNARLPTVTLTKVSNGGAGTFAFTGNNGWANQNIVTSISGTGVSGATQTLSAVGTSTTITEGALATFTLSSVTCTGIAPANYSVNLGARSVTFNAAGTAAGAAIACTFTNLAVIDAVNDNFSAVPINGTSGGTTASVYGNDTEAGVSVTPASVTPSLTNNGGLAGLVLNANGTLTVPPGTTGGTYIATYQICSVINPAQCDTATATILVSTTPPTGGTSCTGTNLANNGGTELPAIPANSNTNTLSMPGWTTTDPAGIEQWGTGFNGVPSHTGNQFIELNASTAGTLTQSTNTIQRRAQLDIYWAHRARTGTDTASLTIADNGGGSTVFGSFSTSTAAWVVRSATHVVSATGTSATLAFTAVSTGSGNISVGNFLDTVEVCQTYLTIDKAEVSQNDVNGDGRDSVGDTVTYSYSISNPAGNNRSLASVTLTDDKIGTINVVTPLSGDTNTNGFLDPGETWLAQADYTLVLADIDAGQVVNVAYASGSTGTNTIRSDDDTATAIFTRVPDLSILKRVTIGTPTPLVTGQVITFEYIVTNTGNVTLTGVGIQETAFNGTGGTGALTPAGGAATLAPGASTTFTANYTVTQNDVDTLQ
jgi:hypothetical protein